MRLFMHCRAGVRGKWPVAKCQTPSLELPTDDGIYMVVWEMSTLTISLVGAAGMGKRLFS